MNKKTLVITILVIIAALGLGAYATFKVINKSPEMKASKFTAVYMTSGDIYFGKMDWFPWPRMTSVWYLQRSVDQKNNAQLSVAAFKKVVWSPIDEIYLNPKQILLWTKIKDGSELAKALENPSSVSAQTQEQNGQLQQELNQIVPENESTTTEKSPSKK